MKLSLSSLRDAYGAGELTPRDLLAEIHSRADACQEDNIWIHRLSERELAPYLARLADADPASLLLYGVPFAIKDNIDLAGIPTTAGCPEYAYTPTHSAYVVARLIAAGALPVGKTNLDQFATGLVGTRSPYGAVRNAFNPEFISGGSSAGSAVAVAKGLVSFALGTDTAGSGRVPAALNNLMGVKPTRGLLSLAGVVPACKSLDCVSLFTSTVNEAATLFALLAEYDGHDPYARRAQPRPVVTGRFRFGIPRQLEFFGERSAARLFEGAVAKLRALGGAGVEIDFEPFLEAARLLYEGPWVAERYVAIKDFFDLKPATLLPVTREIIGRGVNRTAAEVFSALQRLQTLKQHTDRVFENCDCVVTPTVGRAYTLAEIAAEPHALNAKLGHYTNFMNLLDYAAVAVPMGFAASGVPLGATLFGPAFSDERLLHLAARYCGEAVPTPAPDASVLNVVVCGAHLRGLPLNAQLTARGARFLRALKTAPCYRLYALPGAPPPRPGLVRDAQKGAAIDVEEWALPSSEFGNFLAGIPPPLGIGRIELADGTQPHGFLCEAYAVPGALEITQLGGWRQYLAR